VALSVERARREAERERIYAFRYRVYVEEMGLETPEADPQRRWLRDPLDEHSTSYALLRDGEVIGALRLTRLAELPDPAELVAKFGMEPAVEAFGLEPLCATSRFMLDPAVRHGTAILRLMRAAYDDACELGLRLNYGDCSPHLLGFYEHLGFRRYRRAFNDTIYGFKVPILMLIRDHARFARMRSPLARLAETVPDDAEARAWFERSHPGYLGVESAAFLDEGAFLELLATRVAGDSLHALGLLRGLARDEIERFLARATLVRAEPGDRIVRQGEPGDTLFILVSGAAEVVRDERPDAPLCLLGAGDPFGEMGFLGESRRTASVVACAPCEAVVLSGDWLRVFLAREPAIAAKVLLNLSRVLVERLAETSSRSVGLGA
jgi:CRP-like cAMP-binding protein